VEIQEHICVSHCACGTLSTDWIEVGDQWTLDGDLGDFMGDFIGGFGNADVPIWEGGGWGRDSVPPRVARGPVGSLPK